MRYAWDQFDAYFGRERIGAAANLLARGTMAWLARWDRATAPRVDHFLANSHYVAARIARYYNRSASVLYPPVDVDFFTPGDAPPEPYFLVVSALVPYKRLEVAISASARLGTRLKVVGTGPDWTRLAALAGPNVEFLGSVDEPALRDLYQRATALVLPAEEDFGIAPVESLACGRPVIAFGRGGAVETVTQDVTGILVDDATPAAFAEAMRAVQLRTFDPSQLAASAQAFSVPRFERDFAEVLERTVTAATPC